MSQDNESDLEKSEEPTEKRLKDARDKGQVARSKELTSMALLMLGMLGLMIWLPSVYGSLAEAFSKGFNFSRGQLQTPDAMVTELWSAVSTIFTTLTGWFLLLIAVVVLSHSVMGGLFLSAKPLQPDLSKMNPIKGFKRMFSLHALMELFKACAKFILVMLVAVWIISIKSGRILSLGNQPPNSAIESGVEILFSTALWVASSLVLISLVDVPFQWYQHRQKLKMSKQDVKDEFKNTEGNPEIKSRLRQIQRQIANSRMMEQVPHADVIITNPTHFSVALKYDPDTMAVPIVVARGADLMAAMIRRVGQAHDVMIVTAPPLARSIYHKVELEQPIPSGLYLAVAQVLAYVHQLRAYRRGQGPKPSDLDDVTIPQDFVVDPVEVDPSVSWDALEQKIADDDPSK